MTATGVVWLHGPAVAAENPSIRQSPEIENILVTAGRIPQQEEQLSASLSAVTTEELDLIGHTHISEALNRIPGTWITRANGEEHLTAIRSPVFTGGGSCGAFYIAEDGIPVRATGFCNVNQLFDVNSEQAQRIEVLRGPGTAVHGSNALHGVINIISRPPTPGEGSQVALEGGPHNYWRIKGTSSWGTDSRSWRISTIGTSDGGFKNDSGFDEQKLSVRHDSQFDDFQLQSLLSISNLQQETAGYVEGQNAYKVDGLKRNNPDPQAYRNSLSARWYARFDSLDSTGSGWQVTPYLRYTDMEFSQHFLPGTPLEENGQKSVGLQSQYFLPVNADWTLSYGVDLEVTDAFLRETQFDVVGFSPLFPLGKHYDYQVDSRMAAAFGRIEGQLSQTHINADLRFERVDYDYSNRMIVGATQDDGSPCLDGDVPVPCRFSRPSNRSDDFESWSLQIGGHHSLNERLSLTARLAHGFRAPQATELYRLQNGQQSADIDPEQLDSIEAGIQGKWESLQVSTTAFWMLKDHVIFQDSNRFNISDGRTRHYGLEYALRWQLAENWTFNLQGTMARHLYDNDVTPLGTEEAIKLKGNLIDTAPEHFHSAQLGWQFRPMCYAELEWISMGDYYLEPANQYKYAGHDLFNLRVKYQVSPALWTTIRLNNLLDTDYAERADYAFGEYRYFIGEPRAIFVELGRQF